MIKIYGMDTCPDCESLYAQIAGRENEFQYIHIEEHVKNLKEFLKIRDNSPVFDECKKDGFAGIPCFVREDGSVTLVPEEIGLKSRSATADKGCRSAIADETFRPFVTKSTSQSLADTLPSGSACRLDGTGC